MVMVTALQEPENPVDEFADYATGDDGLIDIGEPLGLIGIDSLSDEPGPVATELHNHFVEVTKAATIQKGECLYLDFETIPDWLRCDEKLPPMASEESLLSADEFLSQDLKTINAKLDSRRYPDDWLVGLTKVENEAKSPRKGLLEAVEKARGRYGDLIKSLSTNPIQCRICSASFAIDDGPIINIYCGDDNAKETALLQAVWFAIRSTQRIVGFGVDFFDMPVLRARSMILGVTPSRMVDSKKHGNHQVLDLGTVLFNGSIPKGNGLGVVCKSLGIKSDLPETTGADVYPMFMSGRSDRLIAYNNDDVKITRSLHHKMISFYNM